MPVWEFLPSSLFQREESFSARLRPEPALSLLKREVREKPGRSLPSFLSPVWRRGRISLFGGFRLPAAPVGKGFENTPGDAPKVQCKRMDG